jgi:hypothetical protein
MENKSVRIARIHLQDRGGNKQYLDVRMSLIDAAIHLRLNNGAGSLSLTCISSSFTADCPAYCESFREEITGQTVYTVGKVICNIQAKLAGRRTILKTERICPGSHWSALGGI